MLGILLNPNNPMGNTYSVGEFERMLAAAREKGLFTDFCPKMVADAVDLLEEILIEI